MNGHFSDQSLKTYQILLQGMNLDFSEDESYDFTRCVRPDGTAYGTSGQCRKGREESKAPETNITKSKRPQGELKKQEENDKKREEYVKNKQQSMLQSYDKNIELADRLRAQDPSGRMEIVSDSLRVTLSQDVAGFSVSTEVRRNDQGYTEIAYTVDGSYDAGKVKNRREQVRVAMAAKNQYQTVIDSLKDGSVVVVYPHQDDGKGAAREKAYAKLGFTLDEEDGEAMYGIVKNGKIVSVEEGDYFGYMEGDKANEKEQLKLWLQIITGEA